MIAVTGYSGFIGESLVNRLSDHDCLLIGRKQPKNRHYFFAFDIASNDGVNLVEPLGGVVTMIHLAGRTHTLNNTTNSLKDFRSVNTEGTLSLARQAAQAGVQRFIFLSSIKVNGESTSHRSPFTAFDKRSPEDAYGISKSEAEEQLWHWGARREWKL